jgi:hypothetical protein
VPGAGRGRGDGGMGTTTRAGDGPDRVRTGNSPTTTVRGRKDDHHRQRATGTAAAASTAWARTAASARRGGAGPGRRSRAPADAGLSSPARGAAGPPGPPARPAPPAPTTTLPPSPPPRTPGDVTVATSDGCSVEIVLEGRGPDQYIYFLRRTDTGISTVENPAGSGNSVTTVARGRQCNTSQVHSTVSGPPHLIAFGPVGADVASLRVTMTDGRTYDTARAPMVRVYLVEITGTVDHVDGLDAGGVLLNTAPGSRSSAGCTVPMPGRPPSASSGGSTRAGAPAVPGAPARARCRASCSRSCCRRRGRRGTSRPAASGPRTACSRGRRRWSPPTGG